MTQTEQANTWINHLKGLNPGPVELKTQNQNSILAEPSAEKPQLLK